MRSIETNMQQIHVLPLVKLQLHPQNLRFLLREEVVEGIAAQLRATGEFSIMHALIVRPVDDYYPDRCGASSRSSRKTGRAHGNSMLGIGDERRRSVHVARAVERAE
jgi:hypothetical protein